MKKRVRIVSGLAALAAFFLAPIAEASLTRSNAPTLEVPALALTLVAPEPSEFSLFDGTEIARALASRPAFDLISITTDDAATAGRTRFVPSSELLADELPEGPELVPITSVREQRFNLRIPPDVFGLEPLRGPPGDEASYPKTRYRVFGFLGAPLIGVERGVSLELHWGSNEFRAGLASGTVGWLSQDPMGDVDSPNLYGFVGARPHEKTDPLGLEASLSNNGTIVIADVHTGRIRRISPAEIAANGDEVRAALGLEAGLDPREADAMMKRAGGGVWTNNAKVTALSKGVSEEVNRELRFVAKTYAVTAGATVAGVAAGALGAGALVTGAVSGVGGLATSDVIEGHVSSPGTYAGAAVGGAIFAKVFGAFSIGEGPSTLGLDLPPPMLRGTNQPGMVTRRGSFRKATLDDAWDTAPPGSAGGRLCPTCGEEVTVPPGTGQARDWHGSHNPSWTKREFPPDVTRAEVLDEYQRGVTLECPRCNLGRGNRDELR